MNTTHLFVELLVIGFGTVLWLLLIAAWVFHLDLNQLLASSKGPADLLSLSALLPLIFLAYVLGIITDRVADRLFDRWDGRHRGAVYKGDPKVYHGDRRTLVHYAPALRTHLEYGRSRMRICRGWVVNSVGLVSAFNLWLRAPGAPDLTLFQFLTTNCFLIVLLLLCVSTWRQLNSSEYRKIERQAAWLKKEREKVMAVAATSRETSHPANLPVAESDLPVRLTWLGRLLLRRK